MKIPDFNDEGLLPAGIHLATIESAKERLVFNDHRFILFDGFLEGVNKLRSVGCKMVYLDGSFATNKKYPNDFDACWDPSDVDFSKLDPIFLDFDAGRLRQKRRFKGEFFPSILEAESDSPFRIFLEFFQSDRATGSAKGIVGIEIGK